LIEVPELSASSISCLDDHVSVIDQVKIFVGWKLGDNVEWSFNIEAKVFAQLSLNRFFLPFILIDDVKELLDFAMLVVNNDVLVLSVEAT
jgi:hypothetical protein